MSVTIKTDRVYVCGPESLRVSLWPRMENWENENSAITITRSVSTSDKPCDTQRKISYLTKNRAALPFRISFSWNWLQL